MAGRTRYTKLTANEILPQVIEHLEALRKAYLEVGRHRAAVTLRAHSNGGDPRGTAWADFSKRMNEELLWFQERNIEIKDVEQGLIDFPAVIDGREVLLCWKDGEPEVAFWHPRETGFPGRQPL